jgi:aminoglycoside 6'-N-acetyltransferase I
MSSAISEGESGGPRERIRECLPAERGAWLDMRERLWPDHTREELSREQAEILGDPARTGVLVAVRPDGELAGFVEVSLRDWAEGCETRPVGYVEAWYVEPAERRAGLGRRLIEAAERWALARGCTEMGSDADLANDVSHAAHRALGYVEVGRSVLFRKKLV